MEFQLRAWQQAANKGFSVTLIPPFPSPRSTAETPSLHQVPITSPHIDYTHRAVVHAGKP